LPGGSVGLTGLAGPLDAAFTAPQRQVSATLTSSQATLRLPASVTYRVIKDIGSGSVSATVPQSATATHTVTATIRSGELALLSS